MRTVKVFRTRVAGKPVTIKFKAGMKNLADHWMAGKGNRNPRIPRGEVWVNARLLKDRERLRRVLAHEKAELELMMRKGYSYRRAHRIASKRETSLARRVKLMLLFLLMLPLLFSSLTLAKPGLAVYTQPPPFWYDFLLQPYHYRVWYGAWQIGFGCSNFDFENTYGPFTPTDHSTIGGPNGLLGEVGGVNGSRITSVSFDTSQKYSGSFSLKLYAYSTGGYALTNITLTAIAIQKASIYLQAKASASYSGPYSGPYYSVWVRVRINGVTALEWKYPLQSSWTGAPWTQTANVTVPAGTVKIELLAYAWAQSTAYTTTLNAWFDALVSNATIIDSWRSPPTPQIQGYDTVYTGTAPGWATTVVPDRFDVLSYTASVTDSTYTLRIHSVVDSYCTDVYIVGQVFKYPSVIVSTHVGTAWLDELYVPSGYFTFPPITPASWYAEWYVPNATIEFYDSYRNRIGGTTLTAGWYYLATDIPPLYVKVNSTIYYAPACGNGTRFAISTYTQQIAFTIQDYSVGYTALKAYDTQARLVHAVQIDSLHNAVLNLTPYTSYQFTLWKDGEERAFGLITISQLNYIITVFPTASIYIPSDSIQAWYNQTDGNFYVVVNCTSSPPCTVLLRKYYPNGTNTIIAKWTCDEEYCRYTLLAADPLVSAEATDWQGRKLTAFAGTSLFGLLNETQKQALQDIFSKVAQGWPQAWGGQAGLLAFGGVLIFLALTIPGYLLVGALALGVYITLVGVIFNIWMVAGTGFTILIAVVAIEYIIRQS